MKVDNVLRKLIIAKLLWKTASQSANESLEHTSVDYINTLAIIAIDRTFISSGRASILLIHM